MADGNSLIATGTSWRNSMILSTWTSSIGSSVNSIHLCANCFDMCPHCTASPDAQTHIHARGPIRPLRASQRGLCGSYSPRSKKKKKKRQWTKKGERKGRKYRPSSIAIVVKKKKNEREERIETGSKTGRVKTTGDGRFNFLIKRRVITVPKFTTLLGRRFGNSLSDASVGVCRKCCTQAASRSFRIPVCDRERRRARSFWARPRRRCEDRI